MESSRVLADVSKEFAAATENLDALLDLAARRLSEVVGDLGVIRMLQADGAAFDTSASVHHPDPVILTAARDAFRNVPHGAGEGFSGRVVSTRKPLLVAETRPEDAASQTVPGWVEFLRRIDIKSLIGVPLIAQDRVLGVVIMIRGGASAGYTEADLALVEDLAGHAALAIANAGLLDRLKAELEQRRRAEIALSKTEAQLRQAQKMEAIGRLAGGVAHDFNNLLSVILSYASLVIEDLPPGDPRRADIEEIRNAGLRAADLTKQLLAFSRQQVLEPRIVDLNESITSMDKLIRRLIGEDIELRTLARDGLDKVLVDPGHVEQVIMNLVVNARDAMPAGGRLTIETANTELDEGYAREHAGVTPGRYVLIAVSDTGSGMDKETQERIFEPFFTTKEKGRGTGLGLSTVYGIVKQSRGSIWVYSEPGKGSTFKVYFPRADEGDAPAVSPIVTTGSMRGTETVLLVEDEVALRAVTRDILRKNGYRVLEMLNAQEALRLCAAPGEPIHLLLTDVVMPQMSGRELADRVSVLLPALRILYMSGYTENSIVHHGVLDPGITLLQKPFTPDSLLRKVREVLDAPSA